MKRLISNSKFVNRYIKVFNKKKGGINYERNSCFYNVRTGQIEWLSIRDSNAEESAKKVEGGTMEPLVYTTSLAESTKERCYELITSYMITNNLSFTIHDKDEIA